MYLQSLNLQEAANKIEQIYHATYNPHSDLSVWEQLEICETLAEAEEEYTKRYKLNNTRNDNNVVVNGNVNDTYKQQAGNELSENKLKVIHQLKTCTYRTSPIKIASLLEDFFSSPDTKPGHWLFISQTYPPRRIYLTIKNMTKRQSGGWITIQNPAAYFTNLIGFRAKRKGLQPLMIPINSKIHKPENKNSPVLQGRELAVD